MLNSDSGGAVAINEPSGNSNYGNNNSPRMNQPEFLAPSALSKERRVGSMSSIFSLVATIVGGGCLSLPFALSRTGIILGPIFIFIFALFSDFSVDLLITCSRRTGATSYQQVAILAFGAYGKYITMLLIFIMVWLAMTAYAVLMGDMFFPVLHFLAGIPETKLARTLTIIGCVTLISPFCFVRDLGGLKGTSLFSITSIFILACVLGYMTIDTWDQDHEIYITTSTGQDTRMVESRIKYWPDKFSDVLAVAPVLIVAYVCHFNVLPVHKQLRRPTRSRIRKIIHLTMLTCSILYCCIAILGYFWSFDKTCGNILLNFSNKNVPMTIGRIALGFTIMLTFPLLVLPCRATLHNMLCIAFPDFFTYDILEDEDEDIDDDSTGLPASGQFVSRSVTLYDSPMRKKSEQGMVDVQTRAEERRRMDGSTEDWRKSFIPATADPEFENAVAFRPSNCALIVETACLLLSSVTLGCFIPGIMVLWSLMGASVCIVIALLMPCLFWIKLRWSEPVEPSLYSTIRKPFVVFLTTFSVISMFVLTYEAIIHLSDPACPS